MIKIENINKFYPPLHVLNNVSIEFNKGEITVIVGTLDAGKTTLLHCINKLEQIDSGKILYDGEDIYSKKMSTSFLRTEIGMTFEHNSLFNHLDVLNNITLAPITIKKIKQFEAEKQAFELLKLVGLENKLNSYPAQLTNGEQQRIAFIRAIAMQPKFLLLDEPTTSLGDKNIKNMISIMKKLVKKCNITPVITTQELDFASEIADRMLFLSGGKIVEDAPPNDFIYNPKTKLLKNFIKQRIKKRSY